MAEQARAVTRCDQCGQADDHPKVHIGEVTKHNDCLSYTEKTMVVDSSPVAANIIKRCEAGTRGPALLTYIKTLHEEVK